MCLKVVVDEVLIVDLIVLITLIKLEPFVHVKDLGYFHRVLKLLLLNLENQRPERRGF